MRELRVNKDVSGAAIKVENLFYYTYRETLLKGLYFSKYYYTIKFNFIDSISFNNRVEGGRSNNNPPLFLYQVLRRS